MEPIGHRIRQLRLLHGWTRQKDLAERLGRTGLRSSQSTVSRLEADDRQITVTELEHLARALDVSPLAIVLPEDSSSLVEVAGVSLAAADARDWWRGDKPLDGQDARFFARESPDVWVPAVGQAPLHRLVETLSDAWDREDATAVELALQSIEAAVARQRLEAKALATTRKRSGGSR